MAHYGAESLNVYEAQTQIILNITSISITGWKIVSIICRLIDHYEKSTRVWKLGGVTVLSNMTV